MSLGKKISGPVARKDDGDKLRMDLIPSEALCALSAVLTFGAKKYGDWNWAKGSGMRWSRLFGATMRHLWCWWGGKSPVSENFALGDLDDETKFSHLWHAYACITFLIAYEEWDTTMDDRFTGDDAYYIKLKKWDEK